MMNQIVPQLWMLVPREERDYIALMLGVKKTGITEVIDDRVVTDGYTSEDLKAITHEKMNEFIGSEESFMRAWELTVMRAHSDLNPPTHVMTAMTQPVSPVEETEPKKLKKGK